MRAWLSGRFFISLLVFLFVGAPAAAGPLSERVLFVAEQNGLKKLYICRPDGRDLRRFSRQPGHQLQPAYSRTLGRVFYVRPDGRRAEICSVDLDGEEFRVEVELRGRCYYPDVSPDGRKLLFSTDIWGAFELAELDLESRELKRLTYDQSINTRPRYSPTGDSVLFLSRREGLSELFLLRLENGDLEQLTDTSHAKGSAAWRPDAARLVSTEARPPKFSKVLLEKDLETGTVRYLLPQVEGVSNPVYSVDGTRILFVENLTLYTYDPSDTVPQPFPLRGRLEPEEALWIDYPLP